MKPEEPEPKREPKDENEATRSYIRASRRGRGWSRKAVAAVVALTAIASVFGFVAASNLYGSQNVNQQSTSAYNGVGTADPNFATPQLILTATPLVDGSVTITSCSSSAIAVPNPSGEPARMYLSATSGGSACNTGDFAEEWSIPTSATLVGETATITITTTWTTAGGTLMSAQVSSDTAAVTAGSPGANSLNVFVDYGPTAPTSIATLTLSVT